ncbi:MAG: glycosyltransferase [Gammaproteobacteria bacterium]|nr:glycosyltransferase [Gammaproteobacteria bacterium]
MELLSKISIVILTYKRKCLLFENLGLLIDETKMQFEIIVVDNKSEQSIKEEAAVAFPSVKVITLEENVGTEGRNIGIKAASGDIVITLDDDVFNLTMEDIDAIKESYRNNSKLGALCFRVLHPTTLETINWSHHCDKHKFADSEFLTEEITEGAVALNRSAFLKAGGYPGCFFISHEGPELAIRLMNNQFEVQYTPKIELLHHQSTLGRPGWRRYYYDTRNTIWLTIRNYPLLKGVGFCLFQLSAMFVYSVRDGYSFYWFKGILDALKGISAQVEERQVMSLYTIQQLKLINKNRESLLKKLKQRLFKKTVSI